MAGQGLIGLVGIMALAWLASEDRRAVRPGLLSAAIALQFVLALVMLKAPVVQEAFVLLSAALGGLQEATREGTSFVFGYLGGADLPFAETGAGSSFILGFRALPLVLVMSALSALLFHWGVLQRVVAAFAWALRRTLGIGGALGLGAAANIFVGMVEAPLLIRPYLRTMSRGELFALMTCGMATVAGTVLALSAGILAPVLPNALGHLLTASLISAPAAIAVAHLMVPADAPRGAPAALSTELAGSAMDALTRGTLDGLRLLAYIVAMLVVFVALVSLVNQSLALLPEVAGAPLSLERLFGWILAPLAWGLGIPWREAGTAGSLLGTKVVLNEVLAYVRLAELGPEALDERSRVILSYALSGFANFGSLGIMLGGLTALVPERRAEVVALGMRSILAGLLATCMTGAVVGLVW